MKDLQPSRATVILMAFLSWAVIENTVPVLPRTNLPLTPICRSCAKSSRRTRSCCSPSTWDSHAKAKVSGRFRMRTRRTCSR